MRSFKWRVALGVLALWGSAGLVAFPPTSGAQTSPATSAATTTQIGAYTTNDAWSYLSAPTLHPPKVTDSTTQPGRLAKGNFLVANFPNVVKPGPMDGQSGPLILDDHLQPVWFKPLPTSVVAMDLQQETYKGRPVLTWWQGVISNTGSTLSGKVVVVDQHYKKVTAVVGQDGWVISPHDAVITGNDVWVTSYKTVPNVDLSTYGGAANGSLYDFGVQEYDLASGKLRFTWDAYQHVPLSEAYQPPSPKATVPWDAYHGNSVQVIGKSQLLVSMRNTWAIYLVDTDTGDVVWTLGGKNSSFSMPANAKFEWQHDARLGKNGVLTAFDDNCCAIVGAGQFGTPGGPAKGLVLKLDTKAHRARLVHQYLHGADFDVAFTGSTQLLSNGNVLVGWGSQPYFSEYAKDGKLLLDASFPGKDLSYRALFSDSWVGKPDTLPSGAARKSHGKTTVYASWNGATQVTGWRVLAGRDAGHLKTVAKSTKRGFETAVHLRHTYKVFKVQTLGAKGRVLRTSEAFMVPTPGFY